MSDTTTQTLEDAMSKSERLFAAGSATADTDRKRGMTLLQMARVPQPTDNPDWARGYRNRLAYYVVVDNPRPM